MLTLVALASTILAVLAGPVRLTVYYTSLCEESQNLTKYQLVPAMEKLGMENLKVTFIPFGSDNTYKSDGNGGYTFDCFCRFDCMNNMIQACGLSMLGEDEQKKFQFVSCIMSDCNPSRACQRCSIQVGLDWEAMKKCFTGLDGQKLLAAYGEMTKNANPAITDVPRIFINDAYSEKDNIGTQTNLIGTVCQYMQNKPAACN